jgi:hypothetical protein
LSAPIVIAVKHIVMTLVVVAVALNNSERPAAGIRKVPLDNWPIAIGSAHTASAEQPSLKHLN